MGARRRWVIPVLAVALVAAACGTGDREDAGQRLYTQGLIEPAESAGDAADGVTIVGENIAFDTTELSATAGEALTFTFDNRDSGVPHNFHVSGQGVDEKTEITEGPVTQTLEVAFDDPGEFLYVCDVHPAQMAGTIIVG